MGRLQGREVMPEPNSFSKEFSVVQFFEDGTYEYVRRFVTAEEAVNAVKHYTSSVAVRTGLVKRVIITDGGDCCCFEWIVGKGITFPPNES
jgi:hypothetical protein